MWISNSILHINSEKNEHPAPWAYMSHLEKKYSINIMNI